MEGSFTCVQESPSIRTGISEEWIECVMNIDKKYYLPSRLMVIIAGSVI